MGSGLMTPADQRAVTVNTSSQGDEQTATGGPLPWLAVALGAWIVAGLFIGAYAYTNGLTNDSVVSIYHVPLYTGVLALAAICLLLVARARAAGRSWRDAFPAGYGLLPVGALLLVAWPVAEIGWRQGVGITNAEADQIFSPSRLVLIGGCLVVALAPLRAALVERGGLTGRWPATFSAALVFCTFGVFGIEPAQRVWMAAPAPDPAAASEVWVMSSDGSQQTRVIAGPAGYDDGGPAWSPDGSRIVFTRSLTPAHQGEQPDDVAIWTAAADGSDQRQLVAGAGWYWLPHWSPDGQWITFTIDAQRGPGSGAGVLPPEGAYGQAPPAAQPSPVSQSVDVWRIRADGQGAPERLSNDPAEDRDGVYSPDGSHLLFDSTRVEGHTALFVASPDGSNGTRLTSMGDDWGGTWSPDGRRVAFNSSPSGGAYDIYVTSFPAAGAPAQLTTDPASDVSPSWSPDGKRICFISARVNGENDIWSMATDGSDQVDLSATTGASESLDPGGGAWGPDGRIVYQRAQDGPATSSALVRENLGITQVLLGALVLALLVILLGRVGLPFGAVTLILALATIGVVAPGGDWRFVAAAIVGGLAVDVAIRLAPEGRRGLVGATGAASAFVLAPGTTVILTSVIGWAPGLLIGVALAAGLLAGGAALMIGSPAPATTGDGSAT